MSKLTSNLANIKNQIAACSPSNHNVQLLAVSKTKPLDMIREAYHSGQRLFGENYVQEAIEKIQSASDLTEIEWHLIGPLQSNKTKQVAEHFDWVQSIDRFKIAQRLNDQRPDNLPVLNVCIQVNISNEASKSGLTSEAVCELAAQISALPNLRLRGIMAIPAKTKDEQELDQAFSQLFEIYKNLQQEYSSVDTLSMGMSQDMAQAIKNGSTMVRIGSAIFGQRT
ncbi:YggS family pyridoxal phosphate-dependent enzyme [Catenovulum maritimum]|uniref:Pyridoxal phosphate homeostasis protein n=1 Tax=Catenovulum maritimum TaxID=1513271 RepID=A0A0J8GSX8_9ALTE|nr:YggS family pyridoxal phosphate-dependent enzyme [Catenovulum maritimum]KMT65857.1 hypothetical protein XM47_06575 [Catenovulum maritimum]